MRTRWTPSVACAALILGIALLAPAVGAQTVPSPSATFTPAPTDTAPALTDTPLPTDTPVPTDALAPAAADPAAASPAAADPAAAGAASPMPTDTPMLLAAVPSPTVFSTGVPCATDDPTTERVQRSERHGDDEDGAGDRDEFRTGNGTNSVILHNCTDNRLRVRAAIQLNTIPGHVVKPLNEAYAEGSCLHCQTLSVALQVDLYSAEKANDIEPQNFAVAINTGCTRCVTVAVAIQYAQGVDEPRDVSQDISATVDQLSNELTAIQSDRTVTLAQAETRLNSVIARFNTLGGSLNEQREERDD